MKWEDIEDAQEIHNIRHWNWHFDHSESCVSMSLCIHLSVSLCLHVWVSLFPYMCVSVALCLSVYIRVFPCIYLCVFVFVSICVCVCFFFTSKCLWSLRHIPRCHLHRKFLPPPPVIVKEKNQVDRKWINIVEKTGVSAQGYMLLIPQSATCKVCDNNHLHEFVTLCFFKSSA